jgi:3-oxoacyl-[acyl-carrier protein] reductase
MLLEGKNAIVYGAGGIGGAVARAFARDGAHVFLASRTAAKLDALAGEIRAAGGAVETAVVDALDERAVDEHADAVGRIDVSFNLITHGDVQGTPMVEMALEDYVHVVETAVRTSFITWRAAARHMIRQGSGVILAFGGEGLPPRGFHLGGLQTAFHAVEAMRRQLAVEAGEHGVRVVTLRTSGVPTQPGRLMDSIAASTLLGRPATPEDVGNVAAFVASEQARTMTGATVNVSAGTLLD